MHRLWGKGDRFDLISVAVAADLSAPGQRQNRATSSPPAVGAGNARFESSSGDQNTLWAV